MSIAGKVIGYLGSVFGLYPRSGGGVIVRQPGGTVGSDELQFICDGTNAARIKYMKNAAGSAIVLQTAAGGQVEARWVDSADLCFVRYESAKIANNNGSYCISSGSPATTAPDVSLYRIAAGVWGSGGNGGSGSSWVQQIAARSRVNSNVTNTTITPANITGLSHTLIAGRKYTGRLVLYAAVPTSADGIRIDFDGGTATMTSFVAQGILSDDTSTRKLARTTALATDITDTDLNGDGLITIELGFVCNAAGTFIPRVAKEADAAGATLTVLANSFLWLEDMP